MTPNLMCSLANNVIGACWIIFLVVWLLAAISNKRSIYRESPGRRLRYSLLLVVACVVLFNSERLSYPLDLRVISCFDALALVCVALCIFGLLLCFWARATLGRNWSGTVTLKEGHELIVRGPYRMVRHPIYTGLLLMYLANALLSGRVAGFIGLPLLFASFWIKLRDEEALMLQQFPGQYAAYQQRVKRIIPFVL